MYKLIAIDLDGTLLNDEKQVPKENIDLVNELIEAGYEVVFATGRRYLAAKEFIDCFKHDLVIIANNGNMVRHTEDDRLLHAQYLDMGQLEYVLTEGKRLGIHPVIHVNKFEEGVDMVCELPKDHACYHDYVEFEDRCQQVDDFLREDLKILSIVYLGDQSRLAALNNKIVENYPKEYTSYLMENIFLAEALLEVVNPNSGKWKSVLNYARTRGIGPDEIVAIGDDSNDIEMVREAGLGIGMKNGVEGLRKVADRVTEFTNNDSGLALELRGLLSL